QCRIGDKTLELVAIIRTHAEHDLGAVQHVNRCRPADIEVARSEPANDQIIRACCTAVSRWRSIVSLHVEDTPTYVIRTACAQVLTDCEIVGDVHCPGALVDDSCTRLCHAECVGGCALSNSCVRTIDI